MDAALGREPAHENVGRLACAAVGLAPRVKDRLKGLDRRAHEDRQSAARLRVGVEAVLPAQD
eukprot:5838580-Pyramimonas_sp.AAC.1